MPSWEKAAEIQTVAERDWIREVPRFGQWAPGADGIGRQTGESIGAPLGALFATKTYFEAC